MKGSLLDLPFAGGIDESTRPELLEPGRGFLALENIRQDAMGGATKRYGFTSLALTRYGGTSRSAGYRLAAAGSTILAIDGANLDVYDGEKAVWKTLGRVPEASCRLVPLPSVGTTAGAVDAEHVNGFYVLTYQVGQWAGASGTLYSFASVVNASTMAVVRPPEQIGAASSTALGFGTLALVASYSSRYVIALVADTDTGVVTGYYLDTNTASTIQTGWVSMGTLVSDWVANAQAFAICSLSDRVAFAYVNSSAGASQLTVKTFNVSGVLETATINTSSVTPNTVDVCGSTSDTLWVAWNESTAVKVKGLTANSLSTVLATTATIITAGATPTVVYIAQSATAGKGRMYAASSSLSYMRGFQTSAGAAATDGSTVTLRAAKMMCRPFVRSGRYYAIFYTTKHTTSIAYTNSQGNAIVCDWTEDAAFVRPVGSAAPSLAKAAAGAYVAGVTINVPTAKVLTDGADKYLIPITVTKSSVGDAPYLAEVDFASVQRMKPAAHGGRLFFGGGMLSVFDGAGVSEAGFLSAPAKPTTALSGTGITAATGFRYVAVYEEVDGNGDWVVSGISDPSALTGAVANNTVTVTTTPLTVSSRLSATSDQASGVRVAFYRTTDGGSPPYYRVGTASSTLGANVTFADVVPDATLTTYAKLYSPSLPGVNGSAQDRRAPPGLLHLVSYNGMLVGSIGSDLWHSGQDVSGEGTWFNPVFQIPLGTQEDITGLAAQDGTLFVFTRSSIWSVAGEAPADNGSSGGLGTPRRLAADVGCIDARSIVVTSLGIFFQSARGIELLTRAQSVDDTVWQRLQSTTAAFPVCTAATLDSEEGVVYFELAEGESGGAVTGDGRTAVFDLGLKAWVSTDRRTSAAATADAPAQSACMVYTGTAWRYAWLSTDGYVHIEDKTTHLDPGSTWVTVSASTSWVRAAGLQGEQSIDRVMLLAERHTGHDLNFSVYADYVNSSPFTKAFTAAQIAAMTRQWVDVGLSQTTSTAVRVTVTDATPSSGSVGTGKGATWVGLSFPGAVHGGVRRMPAANRGG